MEDEGRNGRAKEMQSHGSKEDLRDNWVDEKASAKQQREASARIVGGEVGCSAEKGRDLI